MSSPVVSGVYETEPLYVTDQDPFLNAVIAGWTTCLPHELLKEVLRVESDMGRIREVPKGPRSIDIDILLFGERRISNPDLSIPHSAMRERAFVLVPLLEIEPTARDPVTGRPYADYLDSLDDQGINYLSPLEVLPT